MKTMFQPEWHKILVQNLNNALALCKESEIQILDSESPDCELNEIFYDGTTDKVLFDRRSIVGDREQTSDEKIISLANQLVRELIRSGRKIDHPEIGEGFASFSINIHRLNEENSVIEVENASNHWEVKGRPTITSFEED